MDEKIRQFMEKYKDELDIDNSLPDKHSFNSLDLECPYCKINCFGDKFTYDKVVAALEFSPGGRSGRTEIIYDPYIYVVECKNIKQWLVEYIQYETGALISYDE